MRGPERLSRHGVDLEILRRGIGRPLVLLHGLAPVEPDAPVLDLLAAHAESIAPTHPGFGHAPNKLILVGRPLSCERRARHCSRLSGHGGRPLLDTG